MADLLRWLEGPGLSGPFARYAETVAGTREWLAYLAAVEQMKAVLGEGWLTAFRAFVEQAAKPGAAPDAPALEALWQRLADDRLARVQRSPAFLAASRDLVAAETAVRGRLRREVEGVAEVLGLPTRAEIDALAESVHALGRAERRARAEARCGAQGRAQGAAQDTAQGAAWGAAWGRSEA